MLVRVADFAEVFGFQEEELGDAFAGVDFGGEGRCIADFDGDAAAPFGFEGGDVDDDAAAGVSTFADADAEDIPWDFEVFDRLGEGEAIGRDDAEVAFDVDERFRVEVFGVDGAAPDVGEDFEMAIDADVVAVAGDAVGDDAGAVPLRFEGANDHVPFDHPVG